MLFAPVAGLLYTETITVRSRGAVRNKCDPVAGQDNMFKRIGEMVAENSFDSVDR